MSVFKIFDFNDVKSSRAVTHDLPNDYWGSFIKHRGIAMPSRDLMEWLEEYHVEASFYTTVEWSLISAAIFDNKVDDPRYIKPFRSELKIEIHDPHHALLFKLTWM